MKKMILAALMMLVPLTSQALFEVRAGYGLNNVDEDTYGAFEIDAANTFNVDVIIEPPLLTDLGFGLRYETMAYDFTGLGATGEISVDRLSAIVNYRIIDFVAYLGLIGTVGLSTNAETEIGGATSDLEEEFNWSIGAEGGVNLGIFTVGAEVGKMFATFENPGSADVELDGLYGKVLLGIGF